MFARRFYKHCLGYWRRHIHILLMLIGSLPAHALNEVSKTEPYDNKACIECHEKSNPVLINAWRSSAHTSSQPVTDCVACHGNLHQHVGSHSRKNTTCIDCHGGKTAPAVHSYITSKHGAIMQMEKADYDWQQPLEKANYRVPGCSYCHLHEGEHNVNRVIRNKLIHRDDTNGGKLLIQKVCQDCHSPRYITQLLNNGEDMLKIARKKLNEADTLITQASKSFNEDQLLPAKQIMKKMQQHLRNVYLGAGHQSPDYQWWHGQPALDGDLLRIKGIIGELHRMKKIQIH